MSMHPKTTAPLPVAALTITAIILALGTIGAFAHMNDGGRLFVTMIENGLAWCF